MLRTAPVRPLDVAAAPPDPRRLEDIRRWMAECAATCRADPVRIGLDTVEGWHTDRAAPAITHASGRFFAVRGRRIQPGPRRASWCQPVLDQPEIGLLALAVAPSDHGELVLIQAKAEPGNVNGVQLSPTVQATRSNQEQVHGGRGVRYLELFTAPGEVLLDSLQSEHGSVFWHKRNRVMVVRTTWFAPADGFRWIAVSDLLALLHEDNLVHADTRAVLAGAPWTLPPRWSSVDGPSVGPGADPPTGLAELRNWLAGQRRAQPLRSAAVALPDLGGWRRDVDAIRRVDGTGFEVVAVRVDAVGREIDRWSQPMIRPLGTGITGLAVAQVEGRLQLLMQACPEPGLRHGVELGPTVQIAGGDRPRGPAEADLAQLLLTAGPRDTLLDVELSDEGGRFLHSRCRHLVVRVAPRPAAPGYRWCSLAEVTSLLTHSHQVNMQARGALICLLGAMLDRR